MNNAVPLSTFSINDLINEISRRNPWLDRKQAAPLIGNIKPKTLAARDAKKTHTLRGYKFEENGRVKYLWSDIQQYIRQQQLPE